MYQENSIYERAKECLKKYARTAGRSVNEKICYECALKIYAIRQMYRIDTRNFGISEEVYAGEIAKIFGLQKKINRNEAFYDEAMEACKDVLDYIELVIKPRMEMKSIA